jgi:hypothetical protein
VEEGKHEGKNKKGLGVKCKEENGKTEKGKENRLTEQSYYVSFQESMK